MSLFFKTISAACVALLALSTASFAVTEDDVRAAYADEYGNAVIIGKSGYKMIRVGAGKDLLVTIKERSTINFADDPNCKFVGGIKRGRSYMYGVGDRVPVIGKWVCH